MKCMEEIWVASIDSKSEILLLMFGSWARHETVYVYRMMHVWMWVACWRRGHRAQYRFVAKIKHMWNHAKEKYYKFLGDTFSTTKNVKKCIWIKRNWIKSSRLGAAWARNKNTCETCHLRCFATHTQYICERMRVLRRVKRTENKPKSW